MLQSRDGFTSLAETGVCAGCAEERRNDRANPNVELAPKNSATDLGSGEPAVAGNYITNFLNNKGAVARFVKNRRLNVGLTRTTTMKLKLCGRFFVVIAIMLSG